LRSACYELVAAAKETMPIAAHLWSKAGHAVHLPLEAT
jgi:hypothetical protein